MDLGLKIREKAGKISEGKTSWINGCGKGLEFQRDLQDFPKSMGKDASIQNFFGIAHRIVSRRRTPGKAPGMSTKQFLRSSGEFLRLGKTGIAAGNVQGFRRLRRERGTWNCQDSSRGIPGAAKPTPHSRFSAAPNPTAPKNPNV